jgi:hypothetical protein
LFDGTLGPLDPPAKPGWPQPAPPLPAPPQPAPPLPTRGERPPAPGDDSTPPPPLPSRNEPGPAPDTPAATASGLQRRVRGAQMPATEPVNLRRGTGNRQGPPSRGDDASRPSRRPPSGEPPEPNGDHRAADQVYGFLSSFSAGVQRGLDEATRPESDDEGDDRKKR